MTAPPPTNDAVHRRMSAQRTRDTKPELELRAALRELGLGGRYRTQRRFTWSNGRRTIRRTVDLVFPRSRVAVEVHGCYWHGCPDCAHRLCGANGQWWRDKIGKNRARDADTARRLERDGWTVVTVWEHEPPELAALRVLEAVA